MGHKVAIQQYQLHANAVVDLDGETGQVVQTDATLTYVARESGKVDIYTTACVLANASVPVSEEEQQATADAQDEKDQRIAQLEAELAASNSNNRQQT